MNHLPFILLYFSTLLCSFCFLWCGAPEYMFDVNVHVPMNDRFLAVIKSSEVTYSTLLLATGGTVPGQNQ